MALGTTRLSPKIETNRTFVGIQMLRGLAALMVVFHHATQWWADYVDQINSHYAWGSGASGVDIFFVISGFVMAVSAIGREHKTHPARSFLEKRLIRIAPLYWLATALILAKTLLVNSHPELGNGPHASAISLSYIFSSFLFIPYRNSVGTIQPLLLVGWTLSYEMFFYLLFAVPLALRTSVTRTLTPVMILLATVGLFYRDTWPAIMSLASPLLLEFLGGLWLGHVVVNGFAKSTKLWIPLALASATFLLFCPSWHSDGERVLFCGIPAFLLVLSVVGMEASYGKAWPRWALAIGDSSYSLYLMHVIIFSFVLKLLIKGHLLVEGVVRWQDELLTIVCCVPVAILLSFAIYRWVESPINQILRHRLLQDQKSSARAT